MSGWLLCTLHMIDSLLRSSVSVLRLDFAQTECSFRCKKNRNLVGNRFGLEITHEDLQAIDHKQPSVDRHFQRRRGQCHFKSTKLGIAPGGEVICGERSIARDLRLRRQGLGT